MKIKYLVIFFNIWFYRLVALFFRLKNFSKKKILVYTDSRGFQVESVWGNRNPFSSYVGGLVTRYNVTYSLMPYKHTTLLDFVYDYNRRWAGERFDAVVLHCGIVDFSPRTMGRY